MKKQLLSLMLLLPMVVNAAQLAKGSPSFNYYLTMPEIQNSDGVMGSDGTNAWWGYVQDNNSRFGMGNGNTGTFSQCVMISKNNSAVVGKNIKAVRFYLRSTSDIKDVKVWMATSLPANVDRANVHVQNVEEAGHIENLADFVAYMDGLDRSVNFLHLLGGEQEDAQSGRGNVVDLFKIEDDGIDS